MAAVVSASIAVASMVYSAYQGSQARKDQRRANRKAERIEAVKGQRDRAQTIRQNRIAAASVFAQAANSGVQGASSIQGALAAQGTNQAINFQFANSIDRLNAQRQAALNAAATHQGLAAIGNAIGGNAGNIAALIKGG